MKWFKKKEEKLSRDEYMRAVDNKIRDIENLLRTLDKSIDESRKRLATAERVIKYARDDKPTFYHAVEFRNFSRMVSVTYLYIDKKEYSVELKELKHHEIYNKDCSLNVEDNIAYLNTEFHTFAIDYVKGEYVCIKKETEEKKENTNE